MQLPELGPNELIYIGTGAVVGMVVMVVLWIIVAAIGRHRMSKEEKQKLELMTGLDNFCEGIESLIASTDLSNVNLPQFKNELVRRVTKLQERTEEFSEQLEEFFVQFMVLRIEGYARVIDQVDEFSGTVARYGNEQAAAIQQTGEPAMADMAAAAAPVAPPPPVEEDEGPGEISAPSAVEVPTADEAAEPEDEGITFPAPPPGGPVAKAAPEPPAAEPAVAPPPTGESPEMYVPQADAPAASADDESGATMLFDVEGQENETPLSPGYESAPTMEIPTPGAESQPEPQPEPQQEAPAFEVPSFAPPADEAQPAAPEPQPETADQDDQSSAAGIDDDDLMYAQTMQFSMSDIEAARNEAAGGQAPAAPPEPPAEAEESAETFVFDEQPPAAPPQQAPPPQTPPPQQAAPPQQAPQQEKKKGQTDEDGNMISGDDLMEQMDSFFDFGS